MRDPLAWFVAGLRVAVSLSPELHRADIKAVVNQKLAVGRTSPAVRTEFEPEENHSRGTNADIFGFRDWLTARHDKERFLLEDAYQKAHVAFHEMEIQKCQCQGHHERHGHDNAQRKPEPKHGCNSWVKTLRGQPFKGPDPFSHSLIINDQSG
jgi:hypothetical protein